MRSTIENKQRNIVAFKSRPIKQENIFQKSILNCVLLQVWCLQPNSNKFSLGAPTRKRHKLGMSYGKRQARRRKGEGTKELECAIAAGEVGGRQTRSGVRFNGERNRQHENRPIYTKLKNIWAQRVPPRIHSTHSARVPRDTESVCAWQPPVRIQFHLG